MDTALRLALRKYAATRSPESAEEVARLVLQATDASAFPIQGVLEASLFHLSQNEIDLLRLHLLVGLPHHSELSGVGSFRTAEIFWFDCHYLTNLTPRGARTVVFTQPEWEHLRGLVDLANSLDCKWLRVSPAGPLLPTLPYRTTETQ